MKRLVVIPILFMVLFSGIDITIATHYCSGNFAGSKVSFSGKTADCGMPTDNDNNKSGIRLVKKHCCENTFSILSLNKNFFPVSCTIIEQTLPEVSQIPEFHFVSDLLQNPGASSLLTGKSPPGIYNPACVHRQAICIYLI